ncbi:hypothetical protein LR48_Vigan07g251500 [Vigna angularis]|uniref:Putative plant transposon protein domain-containing protein n=1 Tax=Phaseolus angularis TaxID=3914 RepID=A0A0L9V1H2_PHAAN|nr:hypothetical protein LR48_Vigan07g251500 [Vigna angularis]
MHSHKFLSKKHQTNFEVIQNWHLLMERKVTLSSQEVTEFEDELVRRHWNKLATYPTPANIVVVKEFYANTQIYSDDIEPFMSYVRGKHIPYDVVTLNAFLNTVWEGGNAPCQHAKLLEGDVDFGEVERTICILGSPFERSRKRIDLAYYTQYYLLDEEGLLIPPPQPPKIHRRPQSVQLVQPSTDPYQMMEMKMALLDAKLEALHRSDLATAKMIKHLYYASPDLHYMTPEEFDTRVAWLRDQAYSN